MFRWSIFTPLLEVCDAEGASTARIQGSCCPCRCFSNQQFQVVILKQPKTKQVFLHVYFIQYVRLLIIHQIVSNIGEEMGTIWKKWPGFNDEHNMDHEYFGLEGEFKEMWFPIPHEVVPKVLLSCHLVEANTKVKSIKITLLRTWWTCMTLFTHLSR